MKEISEQQLKELRTQSESLLLLYVSLNGCETCEEYKKYVEKMENKFPNLKFAELKIESLEDVPILCSPIFPSMMLMLNGFKLREFNGTASSTDEIYRLIHSWIESTER